MIVPEREYFRPLCPAHHTVMLASPDVFDRVALPDAWDTPDRHDCESSVDGCPHHYSPGCGYFTLEPNVEHQKATSQHRCGQFPLSRKGLHTNDDYSSRRPACLLAW